MYQALEPLAEVAAGPRAITQSAWIPCQASTTSPVRPSTVTSASLVASDPSWYLMPQLPLSENRTMSRAASFGWRRR